MPLAAVPAVLRRNYPNYFGPTVMFLITGPHGQEKDTIIVLSFHFMGALAEKYV